MSARLRAVFYGGVVTLTDLLPPRIRYGYVHRLTRSAFSRPLPALAPAVERREAPAETDPHHADVTCALLADDLDIGGIGSVIEMLAVALPATGVRPVVVCRGDGVRARRLREAGVEVRSVEDGDAARAALADADVLQLHSAPSFLEEAALAGGAPLITVMHNTEIHYTRARWRDYVTLMEGSVSGIAVSETVRAFHRRHLRATVASRIAVVPNGAPGLRPASEEERRTARSALESAVGARIGDDVVFVCLARYDSQKNTAGTASAFGRAAAARDDIRLVFAGDPSDWAELQRARAIAQTGAGRDRIHFLGNSDAVTLLTAADAFVLDSFFEGWPVAATEAAAAGLPLLLSEMGGAAELVAMDPERSHMVPNPAGDAAGITDALVRRARRRSRRQVNADAFAEGVAAMARHLREPDNTAQAPAESVGVAAMAAAHAAAIRAAAGSSLSAGA